jgi:N6-L-threonylcarbamoyladenine synthase
MIILAIDTSCDETSIAITRGRRVLSSAIYSQILIHTSWGGVVPNLAKKAHIEHFDAVLKSALKKARLTLDDVETFAVTQGPGLAIALEVGIAKAKELATTYNKPLIAVNHMEGHMYSPFVQNKNGNPKRAITYPFLSLLISGGHTELVLVKEYGNYAILGETQDDAAGEALDKAAKMLGFGYPGGALIERMASEVNNEDKYNFPRGMWHSGDMNFSYSGLKTSFNTFLKTLSEEDKAKNIKYLMSSYQEAVFGSVVQKLKKALARHPEVTCLTVGGGVAVNKRLRYLLRKTVKEFSEKQEMKSKSKSKQADSGVGTIHSLPRMTTSDKRLATNDSIAVLFPPFTYLNYDNAAMIGVAAGFKAKKGDFVQDVQNLSRIPRLSL